MTIADEFLWMENLEDPKLIEWISEENRKIRRFVADYSDSLYKRILNYLNYPSILMLRATLKGLFTLVREYGTYKIYLMKNNGERTELVNATELGENAILKYFYVPDDGNLLAYVYSFAGADEGFVRIVNVNTGEQIDELKGVIGNIVFLGKNEYYYTRMFRTEKTPDGVQPPTNRIFLRKNNKDFMVFGSGLETGYFMGIRGSKDKKKALIMVSYGWGESSLYGGDLSKPDSWKKILEGKGYPVFPIEYMDGYYITILRDKDGLGRIVKVTEDGEIEELIDQQEFPLENAIVAGNKILAHYLVHASSILRIFDRNGRLIKEIKFDVPGTVRTIDAFNDEAIFTFESFWIPYKLIKINKNNEIEIIDSREIKGDFLINEKFVTSTDGTKIHLFVVKSKQTKKKKALIYGYGGFNISITPTYAPMAIPFIQDGGTYVVANIRGGGEYGEKWHRAGMKDKKQNVFDDFASVIKRFKDDNYNVVAIGRSNGGLLVGAILTQHPEILDGAVIGYPVLDMLRFHKLYIGKAWVPEYGNPDNPTDAEYLIKYSPYHNIREGVKYPPTLIYTGLHDDRVHPAHAFKFAAKLKKIGAPVYLRIETVSGHAGATPEVRAKEYADILAFVYKILEIKPRNME